MTRVYIEAFREIVLSFVEKKLLEINYENLGEFDAKEFAKDFNEIINLAIKALEQESSGDEYIKVPKKALKYRTAGMVAYNVEWLKNHFDIERAVICGAQEPCGDAISRDEVIDILLNEMECVQRASDEECNRDCAKCDLLRDTNKILQAYRISIKALEHPEENIVAIVPCGDAISRQVVKNKYRERLINNLKDDDRGIDLSEYAGAPYKVFCEFMDSIPSVNPQEPKTGRWIKGDINEGIYCSECNENALTDYDFHYIRSNFCPNCGCRMVKPQKKQCTDCIHYGKLSLDCGRCDDDCSMFEPQESEDNDE